MGARVPKTEFLRLFASESTANTPRTHCNTLLAPHSGTPCEFTGRVWEVAWSSGKPNWARDTAKTGVCGRNGTSTELGGWVPSEQICPKCRKWKKCGKRTKRLQVRKWQELRKWPKYRNWHPSQKRTARRRAGKKRRVLAPRFEPGTTLT